jgi:type II secretory pathway pseudopilin PulG
MLFALITIVLAMALPVAPRFVRAWRRRDTRRRQFSARARARALRQQHATAVGFGASLLSILVTTGYLLAAIVSSRPPNVPYDHPVQQGLIYIGGSLALLLALVAFVAGWFSDGLDRVVLVIFGPVMLFIYVIAAFSNFAS